MRGVCIPVAYAILLAMGGTVAAASSTVNQLFRPDPSGCLAADAGAFDLSVKVTPYGAHVGMMGSGLVSGFLPGDVLTLVRTSKSGQGGLRDRLSLSALVAGEPGRTSVVFTLNDVVLKGTDAPVEDSALFVVPVEGATRSFFTSSMGEGEGEYTVTVRCEPGSPSRSAPIS